MQNYTVFYLERGEGYVYKTDADNLDHALEQFWDENQEVCLKDMLGVCLTENRLA